MTKPDSDTLHHVANELEDSAKEVRKQADQPIKATPTEIERRANAANEYLADELYQIVVERLVKTKQRGKNGLRWEWSISWDSPRDYPLSVRLAVVERFKAEGWAAKYEAGALTADDYLHPSILVGTPEFIKREERKTVPALTPKQPVGPTMVVIAVAAIVISFSVVFWGIVSLLIGF